MKYKPPCERPLVRKLLRKLYEADRAGRRSEKNMVWMQLPNEVKGVLCLVLYLGRFGDLRARPRRNVRGMVERCEKCGSRNFEQTTIGYLVAAGGHDRNRRTCHVCGHQWRPDAPIWDKVEVIH